MQINKLAENIRFGNPPGPRDDNNDGDSPNKDINKDSEDKAENEYAGRSILEVADEIINLDIPGSDQLGPGKKFYKCEECEASYKSKRGLLHHTSS